MRTLESIKDALEEQIQKESQGIRIFQTLIAAFKKFEDKKITKHMLTAAKKALPNCTVYWDDTVGTYVHVLVGDRELNFYLGNKSFTSGEFIYEEGSAELKTGFREQNVPYGSAAEKRNAHRTALLNNNEFLQALVDQADEADRAKAQLEETFSSISYHISNEMERALGVKF